MLKVKAVIYSGCFNVYILTESPLVRWC